MIRFLLVGLLALPLGAQDFATFALVPLELGEKSGAHNSRWLVELSVHNKSGTTAFNALCPGTGRVGVGPPPIVAPPLATVLHPSPVTRAGTPLCFTDHEPHELAFSLQVREIGGAVATPPVTVPVVLESDFLRGTAALPWIPFSDRTRATLRIYDLSGDNATPFLLKVLNPSGDALVEEVVTSTSATGSVLPGVIQIDDLRQRFPSLATAERVTIQVAPLNTDVPFWTFVSVTDNETQHLTVFTP